MRPFQVLFFAAVSAIVFNEVLSFKDVTISYTDVHIKNDKNHINIDSLRLRKVKKVHLLTGSLEFFHDIGNDYTFALTLYKSAGNDYKLMPYKIGPKPFCDLIKGDTMLYPEIKAASDFPEPEVCPWAKKTYQVFNYSLPADTVPPFISSGDYRLDFKLTKGEEEIQGFSAFFNVINMI